MPTEKYKHELAINIERYLAALSKLYGQDGERDLQQIIVNAQTRVQEEWTYDNWDGGTYGHALYLTVPEAIYLPIARRKRELEDRIATDIQNVHNVQNEFIAKTFIEMAVAENSDWRRDSGVLLQGTRFVSNDAAKRIWADNKFRLFLSHKAEVKKETAELKERISSYGISCFVAHEDIHPTQEWQDEIENALATMDGFVALMTENFHDSKWTDQEVGYAFARGVPIIATRLGLDPYGFIGKFQGLSCTWDAAPAAIIKLLIRRDQMFAAYVSSLKACRGFHMANILAEVLPAVEKLTGEQIAMLVEAYNSNSELRGGFGFNGKRPVEYGTGLIPHLNRLSGQAYMTDAKGLLSVV